MTFPPSRLARTSLAAVALLALAARPAAAEDIPYAKHLEDKAPSIVTLKYVVRSTSDDDTTGETQGVLADPAGLVLFAGSNMGLGPNVKVASLKVLFGNDATEHEAVLVAHDTVTGFSFAQVLEPPGGKPLPFVDFAKSADPGIGQSLYGVSRLGRGFDFAPTIRRLYVTARIEVPRILYDFDGTFFSHGLPVFDLQGRPVGVLAEQAAAEGSDDQAETFIWPLKDVLRSLELAKKRVPDAVAKAKEKKEEPKGEGEPKKPDTGDKPKDGQKPSDGEKPSGPK